MVHRTVPGICGEVLLSGLESQEKEVFPRKKEKIPLLEPISKRPIQNQQIIGKMMNYSQNFRKQSKFLLVLLLQTTFSTFKRRNDKTASPCRRQGRQKRSQRHTNKTAAFNQLPAADQEAESLQKILQATAVGPGSYKKGVSAHRSMTKRIICNDEMAN